MSRSHPRLDHWPPVPGETLPNPLAVPLHQANTSNATHGRPNSPFDPSSGAFMPPADSSSPTTLPSTAIPHQSLTMYPQITYASPNEPEGGISARHWHPSFYHLDSPQAYSSGLSSRTAQALNPVTQDQRQSYGAQLFPQDQQNPPNEGGTLSTNTYSSPQRSSATESMHSPDSQATSGDLNPSYRHIYPKEPHPHQHQSLNTQPRGNYDSQAYSTAGNPGIHRDCLNPQYTPIAEAAGDYHSPAPSGTNNYGNDQAFQSPPQYLDLQSAGHLGRQPMSVARDSSVESHFPTPEASRSKPWGGADSIVNPVNVAGATQRPFLGFPQRPATQLSRANDPPLLRAHPHDAEVENNVNQGRSDGHSQHRDLRRANPNGFDERWLRQIDDVWNLATRRTSRLTISPGDLTPEQQQNTEAFAEGPRPNIVAAERRESRFKALQLFDSTSEDSRQHEELPTESGRQVETPQQHSRRLHAIAVGQAYSHLGIHDQTLDDCAVLVTYFRSGFSLPSQIPELREALTTIAEARDSQYLKDFLRSGEGYCNPEDNEEQRAFLDACTAREDRCNSQSATTVSSSPDKTLAAADMDVRTPEPSIGGDEANSVTDERHVNVCNRNLSGAIMLKRAEKRLASLYVAPSSARVAKSEVSSEEAEGGIRLDAGKICYASTTDHQQSLLKVEDLQDPYYRPSFNAQPDAYEAKSANRAASALAVSLPGVPSTGPGKTVVHNTLTNHGRKIHGAEGLDSSVSTARIATSQFAGAEPQSTVIGVQAGPTNTQNFAPQPNQLYHPVFESNGQVQWQAYDTATMLPPHMLPQQPAFQQFQPPSFQPQPQRFQPHPMQFYGNPQAYSPHQTNYNPSNAPQPTQYQQAMAQTYLGIPPQHFAQQQFNPQLFAPPLDHQRFPHASAFPQQYQSHNMPSYYGPQYLPSHLHPDPRYQALHPHLWYAPPTGFPAEVSTRPSGDPTWIERYGPDIQRAARHGAPISNKPAPTRQAAVVSTLPVLPYQPGTDTMFPRSVGGASVRLQELTRNGQPAHETATNPANLPFGATAREAKPAEWGVLRVGNIPYTVTKAEILAHLGRNAKIITPDLGCAVHIIMDRATAKTMDCFVEFFSSGDAQAVVNKHRRTCDDGRHPRLGDRYVEMEMSTQDALMKELFPKAKNVTWPGGDPKIVRNDEPYNSGFRSFITGEELVMMVKHAEQPHRSPYSMKCPQRTYECMISTLHKFPWWSTTNYTLTDRNKLFTATHDLLAALVRHLKHAEHGSGTGIAGLTESLLTDLLYAGLNAVGFSERQRSELLVVSEWAAVGVRVSPLAKWWPFEALGRRKGVDEDVVEFYATLLATSTTTTNSHSLPLPPANGPSNPTSPFGAFTVSLGSPTASSAQVTTNSKGTAKTKGKASADAGTGALTLKEVTVMEWAALGEALRAGLRG